MIFRKSLVISGAIVLTTNIAYADIAGTWDCRESGYSYTLVLEGSDDSFRGIAEFNNSTQTITSGSVTKGKVYFVRDAERQHITHRGTYISKNMAGETKNRSNKKTAEFTCSR